MLTEILLIEVRLRSVVIDRLDRILLTIISVGVALSNLSIVAALTLFAHIQAIE